VITFCSTEQAVRKTKKIVVMNKPIVFFNITSRFKILVLKMNAHRSKLLKICNGVEAVAELPMPVVPLFIGNILENWRALGWEWGVGHVLSLIGI